MKCNLPKSWFSLPQSEKDLINKAKTEEVYKIVDQEEAELQEIWIKLSCIFWRDKGISEDDLLQYIAWFKRIYRRNERIETKAEQTAWLNEEMKKCFPTCGFPQIRIDELKKDLQERDR